MELVLKQVPIKEIKVIPIFYNEMNKSTSTGVIVSKSIFENRIGLFKELLIGSCLIIAFAYHY